MAGDNKSNIGTAKGASVQPQPPSAPRPQRYRPLSGSAEVVIFGQSLPGEAVITNVMVDGREYEARSTPIITAGSVIEIYGKNLDVFDEWAIQQTGKDPIVLPPPNRDGGYKASFIITEDLANRLPKGANFGITLFASQVGGKKRILPLVFVFQTKAEDKIKKAETPKEKASEQAGQTATAGAGGGSRFDLSEMFVQSAGDIMAGAAGGLVRGIGGRLAVKPRVQSVEEIAQSGVMGGDSVSAPKAETAALDKEDYGAEVKESVEDVAGGGGSVRTSVQVQTRPAPKTLKQSAKLVGEYLDKHPEIVADISTRQKILSALRTGELGNLDRREHESLRAAMKVIADSQAAADNARLRTSAEIVVDASSRTQAQVGGRGKAEVTTTFAEAPRVSGEVEIDAKRSRAQGVQTSVFPAAGVSINLKQSVEIVGEYLDKNPQIIVDVAARNRILSSLNAGHLDSLSLADKQLLIEVLEQLARASNLPVQLEMAMERVKDALEKKAQSSEPLKKGLAGPLEAGQEEQKASVLPPAGAKQDIEVMPRQEEDLAATVPPEVQKQIDALKAKEKPISQVAGRPFLPKADTSSMSPLAETPAARQHPLVSRAGEEASVLGKEGLEGGEEPSLPAKTELGERPAALSKAAEPVGVEQPTQIKEKESAGGGTDLPVKPLQEAPIHRPPAPPSRPDLREQKLPSFGTRFGRALAKQKALGKTSGHLWDIAAGTAYAGGFTLLGFYIGLLGMDAYWVAHAREKELFPMAAWKKIVTVLTNLLGIGVPIILVFMIWYTACNYPGKGRLSIIGSVYPDVCQSLESLSGTIRGALGGTVPYPQAPPGALCAPVPAGPASPSALYGTCFGQNATAASIVAGAESGGDPAKASRVDICTVDGAVVSWGLFQINLSSHKIGGLDCPRAFSKMYTGSNKDCRVVDRVLYQQCVQAATDPAQNIQSACAISAQGSNWQAWALTKNKCGL